jgi:hypothetical protein
MNHPDSIFSAAHLTTHSWQEVVTPTWWTWTWRSHPYLFLAMLAPPRGVGSGLLQGGGTEVMLTERADRCGQAFVGARDP